MQKLKLKKEYQKYPEYKNSEIDWMGEIPINIGLRKFRHFATYRKGKNPKELFDEQDSNRLPYLSMDYLRGKYGNISYANPNEYVLVKEGEILLLWDGSNAGEFVKGKEGILSSTMSLIDYKYGLDRNFLGYLFKSFEKKLKDLTIGMGIPHVNGSILKEASFPFFSIEDQQKIAKFLDEKVDLIDEIVKKKKKLIELLKEKRTAIINQAVTKGLDLNVKMKDSGVEWIGEIPKNWSVQKLKFVADISLGKMLQNNNSGKDFRKLYLKAQNIRWESVNINKVDEMWFSLHELKKHRIKKNDLLVSEGGEVGRTAIWKNELEECYVQNSINRVTAKDNILANFILYCFVSLGSIKAFDAIVSRVSIAHLTREKLKEIVLQFPNIDTQGEIVKYIEEKNFKIDNLIKKVEKSNNLLNEFKSSLISNVVTGKVKI